MNIPHSSQPHGKETVLVAGNNTNPTKALLLLHGRGATASDIIGVVDHLKLTEDVLVLAPQASQNTWYPERFIMPQVANQPDLGSAIDRINTLIKFLTDSYSLAPNQIALAGFSQGACLVAEYIKRYPQQYLAAAICSGGLIGTENEVTNLAEGSLQHTPVYLGCDKEDFHIPRERVTVTAQYLEAQNADVTLRLYTNIGHTIHPEAFEFLNGALGK